MATEMNPILDNIVKQVELQHKTAELLVKGKYYEAMIEVNPHEEPKDDGTYQSRMEVVRIEAHEKIPDWQAAAELFMEHMATIINEDMETLKFAHWTVKPVLDWSHGEKAVFTLKYIPDECEGEQDVVVSTPPV